ncbi:hypothetical protein [Bacillus subtilis]|uniref:Uncharacterized protein n=1 Tax=Bacillus subtilis TaxID=1423 RepID=A0A1J0AKL5_BACIU|nr:hypothetical protein [Bacillus subtilis]APB62282.1 hypothetical protein pBS72_0130 [Bacillus subtilis]
MGEKTASVWNIIATLFVSGVLVAGLVAAFTVFGDRIGDIFNTTLDGALSTAKSFGK